MWPIRPLERPRSRRVAPLTPRPARPSRRGPSRTVLAAASSAVLTGEARARPAHEALIRVSRRAAAQCRGPLPGEPPAHHKERPARKRASPVAGPGPVTRAGLRPLVASPPARGVSFGVVAASACAWCVHARVLPSPPGVWSRPSPRAHTGAAPSPGLLRLAGHAAPHQSTRERERETEPHQGERERESPISLPPSERAPRQHTPR